MSQMTHNSKRLMQREVSIEAVGTPLACDDLRSDFSAYLDGTMSGVAMAALSGHLEACSGCKDEFAVWREIQRSLGELGPSRPPVRLQSRLREAIASERARGTHLSIPRRLHLLWQTSLAPFALSLGGGLAAALIVAGGMTWLFAAPLAAVQASDDAMSNLIAPRYLYSQVPPQPIDDRRDVPVVVDALVDSHGRVYDYSILEGSLDPAVKVRVEGNLLSSVFQPATVFGVPVRGHVVLTYTGVSVRG